MTFINKPIFLIYILLIIAVSSSTDMNSDEKKIRAHRINCLNMLIYTFLLILTICTIWLLKRRSLIFLHETGLAIIYGLVVGAILHYSGVEYEVFSLNVMPTIRTNTNMILPPDFLFLRSQHLYEEDSKNISYAYSFFGEIEDVQFGNLVQKATFHPEVFFNIILPPIIFNAGYSMKKGYFFYNFGAILVYAIIGTTISVITTGFFLYAFLSYLSRGEFTLDDCLYFGSVISATDPVTVLTIFSDLHVDTILYSLVFGESILNDVVSIVLSENFASLEISKKSAETATLDILSTFWRFFYIFTASLIIGSIAGGLTALATKFTKLHEFPLLESALFILMSYSTFLLAETLDLAGIVSCLFCGVCQAHYTYNNLSRESRINTKHFLDLLAFMAENFTFTYIGVTMFTFRKHRWDFTFILGAFLAIALGRAMNIYPLSFLINIGRSHKIPYKFQHVLFLAGLRGAMAFALAILNPYSVQRQTIVTATSVISIVTVFSCGAFARRLLIWLRIQCNFVEDHAPPHNTLHVVWSSRSGCVRLRVPESTGEGNHTEKEASSCLTRHWYHLDHNYLMPLFTHTMPSLVETTPHWFERIARMLTSEEQMDKEYNVGLISEDEDVEAPAPYHQYRQSYRAHSSSVASEDREDPTAGHASRAYSRSTWI